MSANRVIKLLASSIAFLQTTNAVMSLEEVEIGQLNDAEMMEAGIKEATVSSEPPSNIIANLDNKVNSPDDYVEEYTDNFGHQLTKEVHKHTDGILEWEEVSISSDVPFEDGEVAEIMNQFLVEQMMADMMTPFFELDQLGAQFDGKTLMELLDELDPSIFEDEDSFDDWFDQLEDDDPEDIIAAIEQQTNDLQRQVNSVFGAGAVDNVIEAIGSIGGSDEEYSQIVESLKPQDEMIDDPWTQDVEVNEDELPEEDEIVEETIMTQVNEALAKEDETQTLNAAKSAGSISPLWILTFVFIVALGYGIYLNIFVQDNQKASTRKGSRRGDDEDQEAISLTPYVNRNSSKSK